MVHVSQEYPSEVRHLAEVRDLVRATCVRAWGPQENETALDQLNLAVQEALTNIIRHAYQGEANRPIQVIIDAGADQVDVRLYHFGRAFQPEAVKPPAFDGSRQGGFGVYLIQETVDEVHYVREADGRSGVHLVKRRG